MYNKEHLENLAPGTETKNPEAHLRLSQKFMTFVIDLSLNGEGAVLSHDTMTQV